MRRNEAFPSQYLTKDDLTSPMVLHVEDVRMETIKTEGGDEDRAVLHFAEPSAKKTILNQTNWLAIEAAYGPDSADWRGRPVEVYVDPGVMFGGRRVGGIRIRIPERGGHPSAGRPAGLTFPGAVTLAAGAGMSKAELVAALKALGRSGYNPTRDEADVRRIVAEFAAAREEPLDGPPESDRAGSEASDEIIPF